MSVMPFILVNGVGVVLLLEIKLPATQLDPFHYDYAIEHAHYRIGWP